MTCQKYLADVIPGHNALLPDEMIDASSVGVFVCVFQIVWIRVLPTPAEDQSAVRSSGANYVTARLCAVSLFRVNV